MQLMLDPGEGLSAEMERVMALAVRHQVTMHFIDRNPQPAEDRGARQGSMMQAGYAPIQAAFAELLEQPDPTIADWIWGRAPMPENDLGSIIRMIRADSGVNQQV